MIESYIASWFQQEGHLWLAHLIRAVFTLPVFIMVFSMLIDLFRLYILFSQYRPCDDTQEIWSFVFFIKKSACKHEYSLFNEQDKGSNLLSIITWSVLGKQNVQAKKVYSVRILKDRTHDKYYLWTCYSGFVTVLGSNETIIR